MRMREDYRSLTGVEKAAIFMLALGEEHTSKLFQSMDETEILEISQTMSTLGKVSSTIVERLFIDFAEQMSSSSSLVGTFDSTERLLSKSGLTKDKIGMIMEEIRGPAGRTMWEKLGNVNEEVLANFFKKNIRKRWLLFCPKFRLNTPPASWHLSPKVSHWKLHRMLRMEAIQKEVLDDIEKTLRVEFMANLAKTTRRDSHELMAEIFNSMDRSIETRIMGSLNKRHRMQLKKFAH
jgi:flagellar motor switch protein FliG